MPSKFNTRVNRTGSVGQLHRLADLLNVPASSPMQQPQASVGSDSIVSRRLHRKQAAVHLGVSLSWLDKARLRGDGPPFIQIGTRVLYDLVDLDDYLAQCRRRSTARPP